MKTLLSRLDFSRSQQIAIGLLAFLIVIAQGFCLFADFTPEFPENPDARNWLALQREVDSARTAARANKGINYKFNPNFITDYKGYRLGMSVAEIDRLLDFRKQGKFVNSVEEFQQVTKVSDSLLGKISPWFKFPDWVNRKKSFQGFYSDKKFEKKPIVKTDINEATKEQLVAVYGIGEALSERILKQKDALGGFVSMDQMKDVWGLSDEVVGKLRERFLVARIPSVKKINVNEASVKELAAFPYFRYKLAKSIVTYRSMNGKITNSEDLVNIPDFTVENVKIISLYLEY